MRAILLLSYGTPRNLDEVEAYFTHIRRGKKPSNDEIEELKQKYIKIGGVSPLYEITYKQAKALEEILNQKVYVGFKHSYPFIKDVISDILADGYNEILIIILAPHYSRMSIGEYINYVKEAIKNYNNIKVYYIESWHLNEFFIQTWVDLISESLKEFDNNEDLMVIFTAHSLPKRILLYNDPYPSQLIETSKEISRRLNLKNWDFAYQSQSKTNEEWLGPDILEKIEELSKYYKNFLICPIGFVCDHLEVLYDIDIECSEKAKELNINLKRTKMPNTHPLFIKALWDLVNNFKVPFKSL